MNKENKKTNDKPVRGSGNLQNFDLLSAKTIVESINDAFFALDEDFRITYFNHIAEEILHRKKEEVLGKHLFDEAFPQAKGSIFEKQYTIALKDKKKLQFETFFGIEPYVNWYDVRVYPFEKGISVYFLVTTEKKRFEEQLKATNQQLQATEQQLRANNQQLAATEQQLRANNQQLSAHNQQLQAAEHELKNREKNLRNIIENTSNIFYYHTPDHILTYLSPQTKEILGYESEEAMFRWTKLITDNPINETGFQKTVKAIETGEKQSPYELELKRKDGEKIWVEVREAPVIENGKVVSIAGSLNEITKRKQAKQQLRESEEKYRMIVENAIDGIEITQDDKLIFFNDQFAKMLGYSKKELKNINFSNVFTQEALQELKERNRKRKANTELPSIYKTTFKCKDGTEIKVEVSYEIIDYRGRPATFAIIRDITEKELLEEKLNQAQKLESVGRLAGGVAHDFNNKLTVIVGYAEMLLKKFDKESEEYKDLKEIFDAAIQSKEVTRQLLAFARKQTRSPRVLNINTTIEKMLKMLKRLIGENIKLHWIPETKVWPLKIDPTQIDQILANLCINARDAIDGDGTIIIETNNISIEEKRFNNDEYFVPGEYVQISVSDNGCGIDEETQKNIFDPFFSTKGLNKGTGLGLATVYGIIKQNKGYIYVYSEPRHGTTFKIFLPRNYSNNPKTGTNKNEPLKIGNGELILLVEDEKKIIEMSKKILTMLGYEVISANSPIKAIKLAREYKHTIKLLITDVIMPEMNGKELADKLVQEIPQLNVLFMSGYTASTIERQGIIDGDVNFIQKPFAMKDFGDKIREILS
ncbi:MAG: PAS domain S-box protein [Fidelibacterota bacterium]